MAIRNLVVNYPTATSKGVVLNNLMEAFISTGAFAGAGAGMTLLEDSITSDDFFVVQAQQPTEPKSRMIIQVRFHPVTAVDYIWLTLWEIWTPGTPGVGTNSVEVTDPDVSDTTSPQFRSHLIDLTDGGRLYIDTNDVTGLYCTIHSDSNIAVPVNAATGHIFTVCSIEKSFAEGNLGTNYGVFAVADAATARFLGQVDTSIDFMMWIPPVNHLGNNSNSPQPATNRDRAAYALSIPFSSRNGGLRLVTTGRSSAGGSAGVAFDTYNDGELSWPLFIGNLGDYASGSVGPPVGAAFGYRGVAHGIFGYPPGALVGWRSQVVDDNTGKKFFVYPTGGVDAQIDTPKWAVERP